MKRILIIAIALALIATGAMAQDNSSLLRNFGSLTGRDDQYQGGSIDWFTVTAPEDGRLRISVVSPDFYPVIVVERPREYPEEFVGQATSASGGVSVTRGQQVEVGVTGRIGGIYGSAVIGDVQSDYIVVVTMGAPGQSLSIGQQINATLQSGDETTPEGQLVDYYEVEVPADVSLQVNLSSFDFDTYLEVELPNGEFLENDDARETDSSVTFISPVAGVARVGATSFGYVDFGQYTIEIIEVMTESMRVGDLLFGDLTGATAVYQLTGSPGQGVQIELRSDYFDTYLEVSDAYGNYNYNDDADGTSVSRLSYVFGDDGLATVTVSSFGGSGGDFELSATEMSFEESEIPDGYRLSDSEFIRSRLVRAPDTLDGRYFQRFTFSADAGERVEIVMRSEILDSYLEVVTPSGWQETDDDSGGFLDARLILVAEETGVYDVYATTTGSDSVGEYSIEFNRMGESQTILDATGELTSRDPSDVMGRKYDEFVFTAASDGVVIIDVKSDDFDGYAALKTPDGDVLTNDDDGGGNSNPRIEWDVLAGQEYVLVVTTYSAGSTGTYSVSIYQ